ncbi:3-oxo-tetronate kinase [Bradyrhizobium sp. LA6.7]|uniref:3-oxo-tetronate kinase n=1 Tax=unclassified Bradyrhizobium TaxID=2631580 RepID=UPI00339B5260
MSILLGCIADDYTGASDLANTMTKAGLRTVQAIGVPSEDFALLDVDAVVISLKSRSIDPAEAIKKSRAADRWLRANGARHVLFKICSTFDSTDTGNIGPVMDALKAGTGDRIVIVTPAFPEMGRTVYQGNLFVGAVPLNESPLKDHPLNPMRDANLVRVLARQSRSGIGLVDLAAVSGGVAAIRSRLVALANAGVSAAIFDAIHGHDLEPIACAALDSRLSVGASGLGLGLARILSKQVTSRPPPPPASIDRPIGGPALCLAGSCSQATLAQVAAAENTMPVLRLDAEKLLICSTELEGAVSWALDRLTQSAVLISSSCSPEELAALQSRQGREVSGRTVEQSLATIAEKVVDKGVRRLIVAGGETSGAVVDRLGLPGFIVGSEIAPGVPVLRTTGWTGGDMVVALKSGNFGGPDFFQNALAKML